MPRLVSVSGDPVTELDVEADPLRVPLNGARIAYHYFCSFEKIPLRLPLKSSGL